MFFLKDLNHKIILRYNIISCREREKRQSAEEIQIANAIAIALIMKKEFETVDDNEPSRRVGYQIYTSFRCRNASNDDQGKGIQTNEI